MKRYYIFTDGSCLNNQKSNKSETRGGFGVYYPNNPELNISRRIKGVATNNIGELSAVYYGLLKLISNVNIQSYEIVVVSDSMYVINSITKWAKKWEKNNWKKK